jgi:hypothetical protein
MFSDALHSNVPMIARSGTPAPPHLTPKLTPDWR